MSFTPENIIHCASLILPFAHEIAMIPKKSNLPLFAGFYRDCIDTELDTIREKKLLKNKTCTIKDKTTEIIIDFIAYTGILLLVSKNALIYGYVTGVTSGLVMLFCSVTLAHMYLGKIVSTINDFLGFKNPYILLIVSIFVVSMYITLARILEMFTQKLTKSITIDPEAEKYTQ
jgi:hypothetical protein